MSSGVPTCRSLTLVHDRDAVAHGEGLLLVMGDEHEGDPHLALQGLELELHLLAQLQVQGAEGLVEQQHLGPVDESTGQRHALLLPAGELVGPAPLHAAELHEPDRLGDAPVTFGPLHLLHLQAEGDVAGHVHVGEQGVGLEDRVHRPLVGRQRPDFLAEDLEAAHRREVQPGDHPQRRGLAATRRAQQGEELPVADLEVDVVHGSDVAEALGDACDLYGRDGIGHR